jgi:hypothetical protein
MKKPFPMSFSKLNTYEQCPKKFWHIYLDQTFPQRETEQMARGTRMHSSLEHYGKTGDIAKLTAETRKFKPMMDRVREVEGDKYYEHKMAITIDKTPCAWDDEILWFRGIADVLIVNGATAYCLDHKTGKPKHDATQLALFALLTFAHFPDVEEVKSSFLWLAYDDLSHTSYQRRFADDLWRGLETRLQYVQDDIETKTFMCKPSKLCGWCPAQDICEEAYEERSRRKK